MRGRRKGGIMQRKDEERNTEEESRESYWDRGNPTKWKGTQEKGGIQRNRERNRVGVEWE